MKKIKILLAKYWVLVRAVFYKKRVFNLLLVTFSYLYHQHRVKGLPFFMQIEPTNRCNLNCRLCLTGLGKLKRPKGDMPLGEFKRIIDQSEGNLIYLSLYNLGEPLLNPYIYQMVEYAKKKRIFIRLSTNGDFYDKKNYKNIVNCGVDELVISLDCINPQTYLEYKKSSAFERVIENIKSIVKERGEKLKPFINLQLLLMKNTEKEIPKFKKMVRNLKVDKGLIKKVRVNFPGIKSDRNFLSQNNRYIRKGYKDNSKEGVCYQPWVSTLILWDGSVVPCCFDMEGEYNFGNISSMSFERIWNNENYIYFRKQALGSPNQISLCKQCSSRYFFHNFVR